MRVHCRIRWAKCFVRRLRNFAWVVFIAWKICLREDEEINPPGKCFDQIICFNRFRASITNCCASDNSWLVSVGFRQIESQAFVDKFRQIMYLVHCALFNLKLYFLQTLNWECTSTPTGHIVVISQSRIQTLLYVLTLASIVAFGYYQCHLATQEAFILSLNSKVNFES